MSDRGTELQTREAIKHALDQLPRIPMGFYPTPIEECPRLADALGVGRVLIKRDDMTGLAFGGNKIRHLEFRTGLLVDQGYDAFINNNVAVSNNARINAAACVKAGIRYILVMPKSEREHVQGNLLLQDLMGIEVHSLDTADSGEVKDYCRELGEKLRGKGLNPYVRILDPSLSTLSAIFGYIDCALELEAQLADKGIDAVKLYMVAGHSLTGLTLTARLRGLPWDITGVSPTGRDGGKTVSALSADSKEAAERLGLPRGLEAEEINIELDYAGPGYGILTPQAREAIRLVAEKEAIFLDPVYNGKAMACAIDHSRQGRMTRDDSLVYIHSGGTPNLFTYAEELRQ